MLVHHLHHCEFLPLYPCVYFWLLLGDKQLLSMGYGKREFTYHMWVSYCMFLAFSKIWKIWKIYCLFLVFEFLDVKLPYLELVLESNVSWKQWTRRCIGITIEIWLQLLHSTCLYIIEMLEFIAKQRLAPPKSETLSDSHHAFVS